MTNNTTKIQPQDQPMKKGEKIKRYRKAVDKAVRKLPEITMTSNEFGK